jgi:hypothetical protein
MRRKTIIEQIKTYRGNICATFILGLCTLFSSHAQVSFADNAVSLGIDVTYGNSTFGGGVSFVDFDGDGWDDISFTTEDNQGLYFFKNNGGTFTEVTFPGVVNTQETKQICWIDYDNDGDKDLFVTGFTGSNKFYRNDGGMTFTDISSTIGFFQDDLFTYGASFADIDNDGDLDAFLSNRDGVAENQRNYLYRNDNGTYVDITQAAGISMANHLSFCSIFFDYNNDGFQDIYISNDKPIYINLLYKNNGDGTFDDVSVSSGAGIDINAMTTTVGDYNNDGWFDIYVTNTPQGNALLRNNGDGTFTDVATSTGTIFDSLGWGAVFLDADNDALLDLYVSGGFDGSVPQFLPSAFYHQQSNGNFVIPPTAGFQNDTGESYSNAIGDLNNDGKPDIVVSNDTDKNYVWENTSTNSNNWIKIKLEGVVSNKDGIGNKIEIRANGVSQYRYTLAGEGYLSQNSNYEFVGLNNATNIEYIRVTWNMTGQVQTINNVQPNQTITIQEGNGILSTLQEIMNSVSIYPNPSDSGIFLIEHPNIIGSKAKVFDIQGKLLFSKELSHNQLDISSFSSGIYFLQLTLDHQTSVHKIIKN